MKVVAINKLAQARLKYPLEDENLRGWLQIISHGNFESENSLREAFVNLKGFEQQYNFYVPNSHLIIGTYLNFDTQVVLINEIKSGLQ